MYYNCTKYGTPRNSCWFGLELYELFSLILQCLKIEIFSRYDLNFPHRPDVSYESISVCKPPTT